MYKKVSTKANNSPGRSLQAKKLAQGKELDQGNSPRWKYSPIATHQEMEQFMKQRAQLR